MKKQLLTTLFLALLLGFPSFGQETDSLFSRLQAISNNGTDFFNVDGMSITSQRIEAEFSKKNILKKCRKYGVKENQLNLADSLLQVPNFYVTKSETPFPNAVQYTTHYFVEGKDKKIIAVTFGSINKTDRDFERSFVKLILNDSIPASVYEPLEIDRINFAGRKITLGRSCQWMDVNNVQCPYYGQMNWSVHKTLADATQSVNNQFNVIKAKKQGKIVAEDAVNVIFEGTEVTAKKAIYDFKGITSLLVGMSGGKTLTIYCVAAPVRQHYVSCVMSFWNNDNINPSGLPPLLEEVMKLKK
jgi:hypothetical protein